MVTEIILPKLGQTMEEGTIIEWLKDEGDPVGRQRKNHRLLASY